MSIRKTAKYIFILLSVLSISTAKAQIDSTWERGLRIGFDVSRYLMTEFTPERKAYELSFDTELSPKWYVMLESGIESVKQGNDYMVYQSSGFYNRIGFDYNILKRDDPNSRDVVSVGARYGLGFVTQQTNWFTIDEPKYGGIIGSYPPKTLSSHWVEFAFGCKVEVVRNFFMGIGLRERFMLFHKTDLNYPFAWPGFGDGSGKSVFGLNYSLYYQIPLMKVKIKAKPKEPAKESVKKKK